MNVTDEMVERAFDALYPMVEAHPDMTQDQYQRHVYGIARTALTAALGDVEPLEDVLGGVWSIDELFYDPDRDNDNNAYALVISRDAGERRAGLGWAPTIDAAIRAAVANAQGEGR